MTLPTSVAIIGLGSRGLSVLERIVTLARRAGPAAGEIRVEIIDPACSGAGVHDLSQPDYLLLNTTCSQVSMFPGPWSVGPDTAEPGPSLHEWVMDRSLRLAPDGFTVGEAGAPIRPTDFLPRRVLGEYLGWFLGHVAGRAPGHVRLVMHRAEAVDLCRGSGGDLIIALSTGGRVEVQHAFLTTGYTPNAGHGDSGRVIRGPYPLPGQAAEVAPGETVAVGGFGLSAMDLISALTIGRGGRYRAGPGGLRYLPSGREPVLLLHSRSGVPCRARPLVTRFDLPYHPLALTPAGVDVLRNERGAALDFEADVMPLVLAEMRIAFRRCQARCDGRGAVARLEAALQRAGGLPGISAVLDELDGRRGRFDPREAFAGGRQMRLDDGAAYQSWLAATLRADLAQGVLGLPRSPVKAALDILRELRDTIRYAVDFGGLNPGSLDDFHGRVVPLINRAVVGPQYERHAELLALMSAGVASAPLGPAPGVTRRRRDGRWELTSTRLRVPQAAAVDWLASAHVPLPAVDPSASPLLRSLRQQGWIRPHSPASRSIPGIDVDRDQHPVGADGRAERRLWVLGPLCEGATYYNNLVPSPGVFSRPLSDAHRCVTAMLAASQPQAFLAAQPRAIAVTAPPVDIRPTANSANSAAGP